MSLVGRGSSQVVSVPAFVFEDPISNPAEGYSFFCKICVLKNKSKQKRGRGWPMSLVISLLLCPDNCWRLCSLESGPPLNLFLCSRTH